MAIDYIEIGNTALSNGIGTVLALMNKRSDLSAL
jgi:hypothetical protein